jgi:hypothetical protein
MNLNEFYPFLLGELTNATNICEKSQRTLL